MTPVQRLLDKLPDAKPTGSGWSARCPAHDDRKPSLSIAEGEDGRALAQCHAGCTTEAVVAAVGLTMRCLMPDRDTPIRNGKPLSSPTSYPSVDDAVAELGRRHGKPSSIWRYTLPSGKPVGAVVRFDRPDGRKDFRPVSHVPGGWRIAAMPGPRPLYNLPEVAKAKLVLVVEGEKAADAARSLGFVATTSAGGSKAASKTDWGPLAGKQVWLLPDNDGPGRKYADDVITILSKLSPTPTVKQTILPDLPDKGDIADWIDAHGDTAEPDEMRAELAALADAVPVADPVPSSSKAETRPAAPRVRLVPPYRPFPTHCLPGAVRRLVEDGAEALGCDRAFVALPALAALSGAVGLSRSIVLKAGWEEPAMLWLTLIAPSGSTKTPAAKLALAPLWAANERLIDEYNAAVREYKRAVAGAEPDDHPPDPPVRKRRVVSDITIETLAQVLEDNPIGVFLYRDELGGWVISFTRYKGKSGGTDLQNWLEIHSAGPLFVDRKTGDRPTVYVRRAFVALYGSIQPGVARRVLATTEYNEAGLLPRFLLGMPPRHPKRWTEASVGEGVKRDYQKVIDALLGLEMGKDGDGDKPRPVALTMTSAARAVWVDFYNRQADKQDSEVEGVYLSALSKLEAAAGRLALILHLATAAERDDAKSLRAVPEAVMRAAVELTEWFANETARLLVSADRGDDDADLDHLVALVRRRGGAMSASELHKLNKRRYSSPDDARRDLDRLAASGLGQWVRAVGEKGGRPTDRLTVVSDGCTPIPETPVTDDA